MGLKTIQDEYRKDVQEYRRNTFPFIEEARRINGQLADYKKREDAINKLHLELTIFRIKTADEANNLNAQGVAQFTDVKKLLILAAEHAQPHPINLAEIDSLAESMEDQMKLEMERKMKAYMDKLAASWPSELKPGMTFGRKEGSDILELIAPRRPIPGKTGDAGILLKVKYIKGSIISAGYETTMTRADLSVQKGWRFLKT
jgi:hypothetical protein